MAEPSVIHPAHVAYGHFLALWIWADWPLLAAIGLAVTVFGSWVILELLLGAACRYLKVRRVTDG